MPVKVRRVALTVTAATSDGATRSERCAGIREAVDLEVRLRAYPDFAAQWVLGTEGPTVDPAHIHTRPSRRES